VDSNIHVTLYRVLLFTSVPLFSFEVAWFPDRSLLQYLITCTMKIQRRKAWEIWSHVVISGRHRVDTWEVVPDKESWSLFLYYQYEGWRPER